MRKITLLLLLISFIGMNVYAQQKSAKKNISTTNILTNKSTIKANKTLFNKGAKSLSVESFEGGTFPPTGWTVQNPTGGTGWALAVAGTTNITGWGSTGIAAPAVATGGGSSYVYANWDAGASTGVTLNDQWLISPSLSVVSGDFLNFQLNLYATQYTDSFDVLLSTTSNTISSFTTSLIALTQADFVANTWKTFSIDLSSYVGSTVYIAFREHVSNNTVDGSLFLLDLVSVGTATLPAADVEVQSIDIPALNSAAFVPQATFGNAGSVAQTFTVNMTITPGSYTSTQTVTNLAVGGSTQVSFAQFTGTNNTTYSVTVTATLTGDANTANNTATSTFVYYLPDPILFDNSNIASDNSIVSMLFGGLTSGSDLIQCADDFIVPSSATIPWTITCIKTTGSPSAMAAATTIDRFTYEIYSDNGGTPGSIINSGSITTALEGSNVGLTQTLPLTSPVTLNPGTYWLSVYAEYDTATVPASCRWNWDCGPTSIGGSAYLHNTSSLFGGALPWTVLSTLVTTEESMSFVLYGTNTTSINNNNIPSIEVYPNPTKGTLNITNANNANVIVYNLLGEVVSNTICSSAFNTVDLSTLSNGSYIVKVITKDNTITKKINIVK